MHYRQPNHHALTAARYFAYLAADEDTTKPPRTINVDPLPGSANDTPVPVEAPPPPPPAETEEPATVEGRNPNVDSVPASSVLPWVIGAAVVGYLLLK